MPSHYAALLTIGLIVIFAAPVIYYIFWVDGSQVPKPDPSLWGPIEPMSKEDIEKIESALQVKLPADYVEFLMAGRTQDVIDDETVSCSVARIIEATTSYRQGLYGLQPWPASYIYVGDEADACPYVLDCESGRFFQTHKGNLKTTPLSSYASFSEFVEHCEADAIHDAEVTARPETWRDTLAFYTPLIVGMLIVFVVVPLIAFSTVQLWKWLFGA